MTRLSADSVTHLGALNPRIDLFLHDRNHDPGYEMAEFEAVAELRPPTLFVRRAQAVIATTPV
jgi:hypothetical protein